jgi:hypothetical protein
MDSRAKKHMAIAKRSSRHYTLAAEPWSIWINGEKVVSELEETIHDVVHSQEAMEYWTQKDGITEDVLKEVQWDLIEVAMKEAKGSRRVFISKHVSGMCGVGKFMQRWKLRQGDSCPRCGMSEDAAHVWICHGERADDIWEKALKNLEQWLQSKQTDPDIQHILISYLCGWRLDQIPNEETFFVFDDLIRQQSKIGWSRFFEG